MPLSGRRSAVDFTPASNVGDKVDRCLVQQNNSLLKILIHYKMLRNK